MSTTETPAMATDRQLAFGAANGLEITAETSKETASEMIKQYIDEHPWSPGEREARKAAFVERMRATPPTEAQLKRISVITKGQFVPKSMASANAFFGRLRRRNQRPQPVAA